MLRLFIKKKLVEDVSVQKKLQKRKLNKKNEAQPEYNFTDNKRVSSTTDFSCQQKTADALFPLYILFVKFEKTGAIYVIINCWNSTVSLTYHQ